MAAGGREAEAAAAGWRRGGDITVPPTEKLASDAYAQKVGELKLVPVVKPIFDADHEKGAIVRVDPEPGTKAEAGATVKMFASAGFPNLAFDNDKDILLVNAARGDELPAIAKGPQDEGDPTWSFDGSAVAYTSDGQVFLKQIDKKDASPVPLTKEGERFTDLAWAPTADINNIAMLKRDGGTTLADTKTSLCFERVTADGGTPNCKDPSDFVLGRKINWSPDGKTLLVFGASRDATKFGMVGLRVREAVLHEPGRLGVQGLRHRYVAERPRRARRGVLARRRQAARRRQPGQERPAGAVPDDAGRPAARQREGPQRGCVQGDLAAGRPGPRDRA